MRGIPLRHAEVGYYAGFEAGAASVMSARDPDTPVRAETTRRLEAQAGVVVLIVIPVAAWAVVLVVMCADRLRLLLATPPCP